MGHNRIDKLAAAHLQAALRSALRHVGEIRMASTQDADRELAGVYGRIRRIAQDLERAASAPEDPFLLELPDDDQNLLVSCIVFRISELEAGTLSLETLRRVGTDPHRAEIDVLADRALRLATRPIQFLPKPPGPRPPSVRKICAAVQAEVGVVNEVQLNFGGGTVDFRGPGAGTAPTAVPTAPSPEPGAPAPAAVPAPQSAGAPQLQIPVEDFDPRRLREPRLRAAATLDIRAFEAAIDRRDHRMASVHLLSIVEAAVVDHAVPRAATLGLVGDPSEWRLSVLVGAACPPLEPTDRSRLALLMRCAHFVHPARQLTSPMVITAAILADLLAFARRILASLRAAADRDLPLEA